MIFKKFDIYEMVTKMICDRLEAGVIPWHMPWKSSGGMPCNLISRKPYRGFNFWYLLSFGFDRPYFLTFYQVKDLGGSIRKGAKSFQVVFWKLLELENKDGSQDKFPMLRYYRVFHIDDVENLNPAKIPATENHDHDFDSITVCDELVELWEDSPVIELGKQKACYIPSLDKVQMPNPRTFFKDEVYYSVLFHELTHSTGHRKRLNRHEKFPNHKFGSRDYSQEELVAELGAAYLCGVCGIENATLDLCAAYIQSWLNKLKNDNKFFIQAASDAQKAIDYILQHQKIPVAPKGINLEKETLPVSFSI